MDIKLHHIGFVVDDINKNIEMFKIFGFNKKGDIVKDYNQNNYLQMLEDSKENRIELIKSIDEKSSVYNCKPGIHHLAFTTDNEEEFLKALKENKYGKIFTPNIKAPLFNNNDVFFGLLKNDLIFEIIKDR